MSLLGIPEVDPENQCMPSVSTTLQIGLTTSTDSAMVASLQAPGLKEALEDPTLPKHVHDLKAVLRALESHQTVLAGVRDDVMLYSYLINPTHGSHILPDVTARFTDRALQRPSK